MRHALPRCTIANAKLTATVVLPSPSIEEEIKITLGTRPCLALRREVRKSRMASDSAVKDFMMDTREIAPLVFGLCERLGNLAPAPNGNGSTAAAPLMAGS